ncbi:MAG: hypothetical protein FWG98_00645 [Candidatus Cloacimonetes bacterium]|nr:hypothetical protein [Candidatus Cloacimonadota bacterium]
MNCPKIDRIEEIIAQIYRAIKAKYNQAFSISLAASCAIAVIYLMRTGYLVVINVSGSERDLKVNFVVFSFLLGFFIGSVVIPAFLALCGFLFKQSKKL